MSVSGEAAARYMFVGRPNTANACLYTVWLAYGAPHTLGRLAGYTFPTAISAYNYATKRHADRNPPRGAAVWFGSCAGPRWSGDDHWRDGDVVVSLGGGNLGGTDQPHYGHIGQCTIAERERLTGRGYLGWTEDFIGNDIDIAATASFDSTKLIDQEEDEMSYSLVKDANSASIYLLSLVTGNRVGITSPYHVEVLRRAKKNNADDPMLMGELDIVHNYLAQVNPGFVPGVDYGKLASTLQDATTGPQAGQLLRIQSPGRGIALVGSGYYRHLNTDEEVVVSASIMSKHINVDDRQFDVLVALVQQGAVPPANVTIDPEVVKEALAENAPEGVDYGKIESIVAAATPTVTTNENIPALIKSGLADSLTGSVIQVVPKS